MVSFTIFLLFYLFSVQVELVLRNRALPDALGQRLSLAEPNVDVNAARVERPKFNEMKGKACEK
jgi:hypothetical protein